MKHPILLQRTLILLSIVFLGACSKSGTNPKPQNNTPALAINSLSITSGGYTTSVTITGAGFSATQANDQVFFNGKAATVTAATSTQITATVPLGAGTGHVTVSVNNGAEATGPVFTYQLSAVVTTFAGSLVAGFKDGKGTAATFTVPWGVAFDPSGNLFVTDRFLLRKITPDGTVSFFAGNASGSGPQKDGKGAGARFDYPTSIVTDGAGNLYIADNQSIQKVTPDGTVTTVPGSYFSSAEFTGIVLDASGNIYASDIQDNAIIKINTNGTSSTFAGNGTKSSVDGKGTSASFDQPIGLAIDAAGNIFVVDEGSNDIRKVTPDGTVTTIAGTGKQGAANGKGTAASFNDPTGVVVDATGNLYIGDFNNFLIRKITPDGTVSTVAGSGVQGLADGIGTAALFGNPQDLVLDASGNIYVADGSTIRKITFQ